MATITNALLAALFTTFKADFQAGVTMVETQHGQIASTITSESASNTYGWLGSMPRMREWIGDRDVKDLSTHGYTITNKEFETTVGVKRKDIEDDTVGVYKPVMQELGRASAVFPDELIFDLLAAGTTTLCYDGQYFFDTDHPVGAGVVSNFTDHLDGTPWYLLDCSRAIKPLIYQLRKKSKLVSMVKDDDESVFTRAEYRYGVDLRCNVGFGFWQMAHCSKAPLTADSLNAAYAAMQAVRSNEGRPLGITATHLVVPTALRATATQLVAKTLEGGGDNPNANLVKVVVSPWL